jgi:hypothetical protein
MEIQSFAHAARLSMHLGRVIGARHATGVFAKPAEDAAALLAEIDAMRNHTQLISSEDGQALIAFGDMLRAELGAAGKEAASDGHP